MRGTRPRRTGGVGERVDGRRHGVGGVAVADRERRRADAEGQLLIGPTAAVSANFYRRRCGAPSCFYVDVEAQLHRDGRAVHRRAVGRVRELDGVLGKGVKEGGRWSAHGNGQDKEGHAF